MATIRNLSWSWCTRVGVGLLTPALVLRQVRRGQNPKQRYQDRRQRSAETDPSHERDPREASDRRLGRLMRSATWSSRWRARTNGSSREPFILFAFCALIVTGMVWLIESLAHGQPSGRWPPPRLVHCGDLLFRVDAVDLARQ